MSKKTAKIMQSPLTDKVYAVTSFCKDGSTCNRYQLENWNEFIAPLLQSLATLREERDAAVEAAYREGYSTGYFDSEDGYGADSDDSWTDSDARKKLGVDRG